MKIPILSLLLIFSTTSILAQSPETLKIRKFREQHTDQMLKEYFDFLSIPNTARDTAKISENAESIMDMMQIRGIQNVQLLQAVSSGVPPAIYGEMMVPGAKRTLIFYAHYDGQPVNPAQWAKELNPFVPRLFTKSLEQGGTNIIYPDDNNYDPEWRIYARSASDDKAGIFAILNGFDAAHKSRIKFTSNIKFFFEGEEESGS